MSDFGKYFERLLTFEGGFVNDLNDPGGKTKYGISQRAFPDEDIEALTKDRARELYFEYYWVPARCEFVPARVRYMHFDSAVMHGVGAAARLLQTAARVKADGVIGPKTLAALDTTPQYSLLEWYAAARLRQLTDFVSGFRSFGRGWVRRVASILEDPEVE